MASNARHSKTTVRWGTPDDYVSMSRVALGGVIELDPFSEPRFNEIVKARRYYEEVDNGLTLPWYADTIFVNHPGGLTLESWRKLCNEYYARRFKAIWVGFSVEQLNLLADEAFHPTDYSILYCRKRIPFEPVERTPDYIDRPSHGNYIVGMGMPDSLFRHAFAGRGKFQTGPFAIK